VRHSSEVTKSAGAGERRGQDLARKHSDSSRHSDKLAPAVHSTNLGNPDKLSFAKPERPVMSKNDRNIAKNETSLQEAAPEKQSSEGSVIGWKSEIISNNRVSDILACKESNGVLSKEKENISGPCKELQELKSHVIEIQKDFQRQVIILKNELEDEKQARIKLEAEVRTLKKLVNK